MNASHQYSFNLPWPAAILGAIFYIGLSFLTFRLGGDFTGIIFVCFIALSAIFALFAIFMFLRRVVFPRVLELTDDAIVFPHGFPLTRTKRIAYTEVIRLSEWIIGNKSGLRIATGMGMFEIAASFFPDSESYQEARNVICSKAKIALPEQSKEEPLDLKDWKARGFPEPILRWIEPQEWPRYRTHPEASKPLLPRLAKALWFFICCVGVFVLPWLLFQLCQLPTASVAGYLGLSIAVAFLITLFYHWFATIHPVHITEISFRERGVTQFFGKQTWDFKYSDFSGWIAVERQFEERDLHILLLKGRSRVFEFALPDIATRDRLEQFFQGKGIPRSRDLVPSWESRV